MPDHDALTRAEHAWIERRHTQQARDNDRPARSLTGRMQTATDRWSLDAAWIAIGLKGATATLPPPRRPSHGRRGSGHSDPTAAQLHATLDTVGREAETFAHLTGPCARDSLRDETGRMHECPDPCAVDLADLAGIHLDPEIVVDALLGTPPSSTRAFADAADLAAAWHTKTASLLLDAWQQAWRDGAEPSILDHWTSQTEQLQRHITAQAGRLAEWSGRRELTCVTCGGLKPDQRRECGRCRTAAWRRRASGQ